MIAATAIMLTACGGGAGGTPTVTYTATSVCASGPALTSTVSQAAANARVPADCPALPFPRLALASASLATCYLSLAYRLVLA